MISVSFNVDFDVVEKEMVSMLKLLFAGALTGLSGATRQNPVTATTRPSGSIPQAPPTDLTAARIAPLPLFFSYVSLCSKQQISLFETSLHLTVIGTLSANLASVAALSSDVPSN